MLKLHHDDKYACPIERAFYKARELNGLSGRFNPRSKQAHLRSDDDLSRVNLLFAREIREFAGGKQTAIQASRHIATFFGCADNIAFEDRCAYFDFRRSQGASHGTIAREWTVARRYMHAREAPAAPAEAHPVTLEIFETPEDGQL